MDKYGEIKEKLYREYTENHSKSFRLHQEAQEYLPGGDTRTATYFKPFPHFMERGKGCYVWDADGNRLIDFQNNYTSLIHGHAHEGIVKAVNRQISIGSAYSAPVQSQIKLAKILCDRIPSMEQVRFANSGTEATMHAIRGARAYTGKTKIMKIEGGYHGTCDIFEASVDPELKKAGSIESPRPVPDSKGVPESSLDQVIIAPFNNIEVTKRLIEENYDDLAALIIEPVMGSAGMITPTHGYLQFIRSVTRQYNILLIFDEVVTFRLSLGGAQRLYNIEPDMTALGKIIGGGMPIGAFGGSKAIMKMYDPAVKTMYHSGTFNGNSISMAAGIAAMEDYGKDEIAQVNTLGEMLRHECRNIFKRLGLDIKITGIGSLSNIVFSNQEISEYRGVALSHEELNVLLNLSLINKNVFNAPRGMFCTSTAMKEEEIDCALTAIEASLIEILPAVKEKAPELITE